MKTIYGLELDRTAFVTVTIQSNPRPETHWNIDNNIQIHQGDTKEKYEAQAPKEIAEGKWNVTLVIDKLSLEDTQKEYKLTADNALGRQEYKIKISPSDAPISDLDMGAIIGIAVACILVIIVIGLVIAARATGRWCFAETSKDASNKTNSNDEENSNGLKTIGQQIVPFKQRLLGMVARARGKHCDDNQDVIPNKEENDEYNEKISTETAILEDDQKQTLDNKNSNQLIYAELDIKTMPEIVNRTAVEKKTNDNQEKTEYAEILYVSPQNN
uniref:CSON004472 protein n=1 Tax=Culicoides sonorensis TaxID=179676 RepID=A0A336L6I2_CULSO